MKIYGIPNCETVRKARAWLDARGLAHEFVDFRKHPPTDALLARWVGQAGWERLVNRRGTTWRTLDAATRQSIGDERSALALMAARPTVIKRPIVEAGDGLVVGFDADEWTRRFGRRGQG